MVLHGRPHRLRVGEIPYLNCVPLFHCLREQGASSRYVFVRDTPARLNRLLVQGKIDAAPSSSIEYAIHPEKYRLLPGLSISSLGAVKSVLLFSKRPLNSLKGRHVALTSSSASGAALMRILFRTFLKVRPRFISTIGAVPSIPPDCEAALVIGDDALRYSADAPYVFDLGSLWYRFTRLHFVFALWIVRKDAFERAPLLFHQLHSDLVEAASDANRSLPTLARTSPEKPWMTEEGLLNYWKSILYDLTPAHIRGLKRFYGYARDAGIIPDVPPLKFIG